MKFTQSHIWRCGVLGGLAVALAACGTTYGTGVNPGVQTVKDLTGMLSLGAGSSSGPEIAYEARPGIVPPPANAALPAPGSGVAVQNWPTDPDVVAREQKIANANQRPDTGTALVDPGFRMPKQSVVVVNEDSQTNDDDLLSLTGKKQEQQTLFAKAKGGAAGQVDAEGNPVRTALTEPPADYRIPDPTAPEEFEAASKRGLFKKKVKTAPSDMGGGTDDIADPNVSIADQ
jgi:hypothetical protein